MLSLLQLASLFATGLVTPSQLTTLISSSLRPSSYLATSPAAARRVADACAELEATAPPPLWPRDLRRLDGSWRLIYSSALAGPQPPSPLDGLPAPPAALLAAVESAPFAPLGGGVQQNVDVFKRRIVNVVELSPWPTGALGGLLSSAPGPLGQASKQLQAARVVLELDHSFSADGDGSDGARRGAAGSTISTSRHISPHLPTSPRISPPHISPCLPTSPHISPHLPASPHISPCLPTSPHISPHLPSRRAAAGSTISLTLEEVRRELEGAAGGGDDALAMVPRASSYSLPPPLRPLASGKFATTYLSGILRISRAVPPLPSAPAELRVFVREGGGDEGATWQEEEDARTAAAEEEA
ncbi:hypothetical protein EMIHUDRAFT_442741, partial [Emiliania huxleyi CCMP1516]|uniref:Plastid lipid-associated protein/fibrillin conserved domain-containing protein n=2 Tax=Emiliania huxleyi TaxID=2903 RepID=A0A0D3K1C0_EMIH1